MDSIEVVDVKTEAMPGFKRRSAEVVKTKNAIRQSLGRLHFDIPDCFDLPPEHDMEPFLLATAMFAMQENVPLVLDGWVSAHLLAQMTEFGETWHCWLPQKYYPLVIKTKTDVSLPSQNLQPLKAVCAFSGGVDATYAAYHAYKNPKRGLNLSFGIIAHGLDIPLADDERFNRAFELAQSTLADIDLPLHTIRTNARELWPHDWFECHGPVLASCLHWLKQHVSYGIIGSAEPYNTLINGVGSNPVTDPLLSSPGFHLMHYGAAKDRTAKVGYFAKWQKGVQNLRVCWQNNTHELNCGVCTKCLFSKMNFLVQGLPVPDCFRNKEVKPSQIITMNFYSPYVRHEWNRLFKAAMHQNMTWPLIAAIGIKLMRGYYLYKVKMPVVQCLKGFYRPIYAGFKVKWPQVAIKTAKQQPAVLTAR